MNDIILMLPIIAFFSYATIMFFMNKFIFGIHMGLLAVLTIANFILSINNGGEILILILQAFFAIVVFVAMVLTFSKKASGETMVAFTAIIALAPISKDFGIGLSGIILTFVLFLAYAAVFYRKEFSKASDEINSMVSNSLNSNDGAGNGGTESNAVKMANMTVTDDAVTTDPIASQLPEQELPESDTPGDDNGVKEPDDDIIIKDIPRTLKGDLIIGVLSTYDGQLKLPDYSYLPDRETVKNDKRISFSIFVLISYVLVALSNFAYVTYFLDN